MPGWACDSTWSGGKEWIHEAKLSQLTNILASCVFLSLFDTISDKLWLEGIMRSRKYLLRDLPILIGDKIQLMQVFINILHNSIEACDDKDKSYEICIHTFLNSDDQIQITITDTGSGIEADLGAHIFEPYYTTKSLKNSARVAWAWFIWQRILNSNVR